MLLQVWLCVMTVTKLFAHTCCCHEAVDPNGKSCDALASCPAWPWNSPIAGSKAYGKKWAPPLSPNQGQRTLNFTFVTCFWSTDPKMSARMCVWRDSGMKLSEPLLLFKWEGVHISCTEKIINAQLYVRIYLLCVWVLLYSVWFEAITGLHCLSLRVWSFFFFFSVLSCAVFPFLSLLTNSSSSSSNSGSRCGWSAT